ncbi:MAG: NAD-dependent epimerase/dehydratase family protein [Candidatus Eisenbacteria bacterium]
MHVLADEHSMRGHRALVLGGSGLIGSHAARSLLARGASVRVLTRDRARCPDWVGASVELMEGDPASREVLRRALDGCTLVVHAAAPYPRSHWNAESQARAAEDSIRVFMGAATERTLLGIVFVSSVTTIGPARGRAANEDDPFDPTRERSPYFVMKHRMERVVLEAAMDGAPVVVVNPSLTIGAHDRSLTTGRLLIPLARGGMPIYLPGVVPTVAARDVGEAIAVALLRGTRGRRYILSNENYSAAEFLARAARVAGVRAPRVSIPLGLAEAVAFASEGVNRLLRRPWPALPVSGVRMIRHSQALDPSRARKELALAETPVEEALREAFDWYRAEGHL